MNKRVKIALILVAVILVAALAVSLAYSAYFTKVEGKGEAVVAKWSFDAKSGNESITSETTINLADTRDANANVATGKVAPGTSGSFSIELDATETEVALDYSIQFANVTGGTFPTNLKFYSDSTYATEIADITSAGMTGTIGLNDTKTKTVTIYWKWDYQTGTDATAIAAGNTQDTTDGVDANTITFDIIITGTQAQ